MTRQEIVAVVYAAGFFIVPAIFRLSSKERMQIGTLTGGGLCWPILLVCLILHIMDKEI